VAGKTKNELLTDVRELREISEKYAALPAGAGRNLMHMLHFGILRLEAELGAYERERTNVANYKKRQALKVTTADVPLEFGE